MSEAKGPALLPPVDVIEDTAGITVYADLPGVSREQLQIEIDGDTLTLQGALALPLAQGVEASHAEVNVPRYRRVFTLSRDLDSSQLQAELKHGVLRLRIPKAQHAQPRRIEVRAG